MRRRTQLVPGIVDVDFLGDVDVPVGVVRDLDVGEVGRAVDGLAGVLGGEVAGAQRELGGVVLVVGDGRVQILLVGRFPVLVEGYRV